MSLLLHQLARGNRAPFDQILLGRRPDEDLAKLAQEGVIAAVFPEVAAMVGFGGKGHKALWPHTMQVVRQTVPRLAVRWAALFHDTGKVKCFSTASGKVTFHGHEVMSARLFRGAARRTGLFDSKLLHHVEFLIANLGLVEAYESDWTDSAVRRLYKLVDTHFEDLLALSRADITTKYQSKREQHHARVKELADRAAELARLDAIPAALPKGLGAVVSQALGIPPSRALGQVMKALEAAVEAGELPRQGEVEVYLDYARRLPPEPVQQ